MMDGKLTHAGQVGREQTVQTGAKAAEMCALNTLANLKAALGSLDRVTRVVFVSGYVNAVDGFTESPAVINGASDLFLKVFGEAGRHARAAVAVNGLPRGATAEIQAVIEVAERAGLGPVRSFENFSRAQPSSRGRRPGPPRKA
jgi:enamine deaminase RidA (YjgF/YER057c/UK114 family)